MYDIRISLLLLLLLQCIIERRSCLRAGCPSRWISENCKTNHFGWTIYWSVFEHQLKSRYMTVWRWIPRNENRFLGFSDSLLWLWDLVRLMFSQLKWHKSFQFDYFNLKFFFVFSILFHNSSAGQMYLHLGRSCRCCGLHRFLFIYFNTFMVYDD